MKQNCKKTATLSFLKILLILLVLSGFAKFSYSQTYIQVNITQPAKLHAHAGNDTSIVPGNPIVLGATPTATGGAANYTYLWTPYTYLDNANIAHPTAIPNDTIKYTLHVTDANGCSDSSSITINVNTTVSFENLSDDNFIKVFPNPSHGKFEIELSNINSSINLSISNNSGQIVYSKQIEKGSLQMKNRIDLSGLAKGDYFLKIKNTDIDITKKIVLY